MDYDKIVQGFKTTEFILQTTTAVLTILFAAIGIYFVLVFTGNDHNSPTKSPATTLSPYQEKNTMNAKIVVQDFSNSAPNQVPTAEVERWITTTGEIESGYVYVLATADKKALQTSDPEKFDDIYANLIEWTNEGTPESREYGGHLIAAAGLETPKNNDQTEILFPLTYVPYIKSFKDPKGELPDSEKASNSNWLQLLNDKEHREKINIYSSTVKIGTIQKFIIYYTCKKDSNCSIEVN